MDLVAEEEEVGVADHLGHSYPALAAEVVEAHSLVASDQQVVVLQQGSLGSHLALVTQVTEQPVAMLVCSH